MRYRSRQVVRFGDVDSVGIVYYPRFFHYFHVAMEEYFDEGLRIDYRTVLAERRFGLPTVHAEADYRRPLRYGDRFEVVTEVAEIRRTSLEWRYAVELTAEPREVVAVGRTVSVGVDLDTFAKREIPAWLREAVQAASA